MPSNDSTANKSESDVIFSILNGSNFKLKPDDEKLKIIKTGRPQPRLNITGKETAPMSSRSLPVWYSVHRWLCGSKTYNKIFCWPCILMRPETSSWCSTGVDDFKKFPFLVSKHMQSKSHLKAVSEYNETLINFDLPVEFINETSFECKEEDLSDQTDEDTLIMDPQDSTKKKSPEKQETVGSGEPDQKSYNVRGKPKITFKTWQEIHRNTFPIPKTNFVESLSLYKWQRKTAKQEFKNAKLIEEKLKLEIEVLKAKAEFYKGLKENSNKDEVLSTDVPATLVPEVSKE